MPDATSHHKTVELPKGLKFIDGLPHREQFINDYHLGRYPPTLNDGEPEEIDFERLAKQAPYKKSCNPPTAGMSLQGGPYTPDDNMATPLDDEIFAINGNTSNGDMFPTAFLEGVPIPQRLAQCVDYWRDILHAPAETIKSITEGWPIPWRDNIKPPPCDLKNPKFTTQEALFMWEFAKSLEAKGIVREEISQPMCVLPVFCQDKSDNPAPTADGQAPDPEPKGKRFLINGKTLKDFMDVPHFKLEDLTALIAQMEPNRKYYAMKVDLKDAYFCCPIPEADRTYFGFSLLDPNGKKHYFVFCALCQGTSQSSYVFDRLLKPALTQWRKSVDGVSVFYVDDGIGAHRTFKGCQAMCRVIVDILTKAGFIINWKKCVLWPTLAITALGFNLDFGTTPPTITPSAKRVSNILNLLHRVLGPTSAQAITPREACSIGGKIGSDRFVLGADACLRPCPLLIPLCHRAHQGAQRIRYGPSTTSFGNRGTRLLAQPLQLNGGYHQVNMASPPVHPSMADVNGRIT